MVKKFKGKESYNFTMKPSMKIHELKSEIEAHLGIPTDQCKLMDEFMKVLDDYFMLSSYGLDKKDRFVWMVPLQLASSVVALKWKRGRF